MMIWESVLHNGTYFEARGPSKSLVSRVIIGVTPLKVLIAVLATGLLRPLGR